MTTQLYEYEFDCSTCHKHVKGSSIYPQPRTLCFDCEATLKKIEAGNAIKACERCGVTIAPNNPAVRFCSLCGHMAYCEDYETAFADVIEFCQTHVNANSSMWHTGGGCMGIGIEGDGYHLLVTDEEGPLPWRNEVTGWAVSLYDKDGNQFDGSDPYDYIEGASLEDLATMLERFIARIRTDYGVTTFSYGEVQ